MRIIDFLQKENSKPWTGVLALTLVSGFVNGAILAIINAGAQATAANTPDLRLVLLFLVAMATFIVAKRVSLSDSVERVESMVRRLRLRICDRIRRSELQFVEGLGKGELYTTIAQDTNLISQAAFVVSNALQQLVMLCFGLFYIAYLSRNALLIILGCIAIGVVLFQRQQKNLMGDLSRQAILDSRFLESVSHLIDGFKELRLNSKKNAALYGSLEKLTSETETLKTATGIRIVTNVMFSQVFFYTLIAIVIFLLPRYVDSLRTVVFQLVAAILFIMAPLEMIVGAIPMVARSNVALDRLYKLEKQLDEHLADTEETTPKVSKFRQFRKISLEAASFRYQSSNGSAFEVGPLDLTIERGSLLFIVGGNGSGKSTLLKLMTGLYPATSGHLRVDNVTLTSKDLPSYRNLFSAIFTDFHLFDRLYGMEKVDDAVVQQLIEDMGLSGKTSFKDCNFTNLNLSTGQRKRLALIVMMLEDREVCIFDEWAADQDVHFRERFYTEVLPELRAAGKAVVAVTHDDRYWHLADQLIKLDAGKLVPTQDMMTKSSNSKKRRNSA